MTAPPAGALEACLALLIEQMDMLHDDYASYYDGIAQSPIALRVKLADIADNADESRLALLDEATAARLRRKYAKALLCLRPNTEAKPAREAGSGWTTS